jgi:glyoxylase-like metal-dependent hydrolase (beta-lactamase superfamily II)
MTAETVADGVRWFVNEGVVNWYLVETDEGPVAIDAGFPTAWRDIEERAGELRAIVITHAHVDHLGFAEKARKEQGVPVFVPEGDAQLARNTFEMAKPANNPLKYVVRHGATRRLYWRALRSGGPRGEALRDFKTFGPASQLPGGLTVVPTPGHTFGHASLHLPDRDVLFAGDALVTRDPYTDRDGPRLVARAATADVERATASLDAIAATGAGLLLTGHGEPWTDGAEAAVERARQAGAA